MGDVEKPFDKARVVGLSGSQDGVFMYHMSAVAPFASEEDRQWMLEMIDLFRRMVARAPLSIHVQLATQNEVRK